MSADPNGMIAKAVVTSCLLLFTICLSADVEKWQGFEIHYTTLSSLLIPDQVALAHGIVRSRNQIVTNIAVRKKGQAIRAELSGFSVNLLNQLFEMKFQAIVDSGAVYYLSSQLIDERDTLVLEIDITPDNHPETYHLKFTRQYY